MQIECCLANLEASGVVWDMLTLDRTGPMARVVGEAFALGEDLVGPPPPAGPHLYFVQNPIAADGYVLNNKAVSKLVAADLHVEIVGIHTMFQLLAGVAPEGTGHETNAIGNYIANHGHLVVVGLHIDHLESGALCTRTSNCSIELLLQVATCTS